MLDKLLEIGQKEIQVISFRLQEQEYALPVIYLKEIIMMQAATRISKSPPFVEGVIDLRGKIIPIIDTKKRMRLKNSKNPDSINKRIMIIENSEEMIGLIVDKISEIVYLKIDDIELSPVDSDDNCICGVGKFENRFLILLDFDKLLDFNQPNNMAYTNNN